MLILEYMDQNNNINVRNIFGANIWSYTSTLLKKNIQDQIF